MGFLAGVFINSRWNREIPFAFTFRPDWESILTILRVGIPSTLVQVLTGLVGVAMNTILLTFSTTAVAVFGICNRMQGICTVGGHGINNGLIPIVAYNYGAKKKGRIAQALYWAMIDSVLLFLPFLLVLECMPGVVLRLFNASSTMLEIGTPAVRLMALACKLLFIISDGQPNHEEYGGEAAAEDIRSIVKRYRKKGVEIIAAAIGSDREQIREIYGDGFLDVADTAGLPKSLAHIIRKRVMEQIG